MKMRVVGKRRYAGNAVEDSAALQRLLNQLKPNGRFPKGVYRFSSFKEADEWMVKEAVNILVPPKFQIS